MRAIVPGDYTRFLTYAPRVVSILEDHPITVGYLFPQLKDISLHENAFHALERSCPIKPLFRNLQALSLHRAHIPPRALVAPSLKLVRIDTRKPLEPTQEEKLADVVHYIRSTCPRLQDLTFALEGCTPHFRDILTTTLLTMTSLTSFSSEGMSIPLDALLMLSQLPALSILKTDVTYPPGTGHFSTQAFPMLSNLQLTTAAPHVAGDIVCAVSSPTLKSLNLTIKANIPRLTITQLFCTLSTQHSHLDTIKLGLSRLHRKTGEVIHPSDLQPLLSIRGIKHMNMSACPVAVDDQLMRAISNSWRQLERLEISASSDMRPLPGLVSLVGLAYLSYGCPNLKMVGLPVDTDVTRIPTALPGLPNALGEEFLPCDLTYMHVGASPIRDPVTVAAYLSDIFPLLNNISTHPLDRDLAVDNHEALMQWRRAADMHLMRWICVQRLVARFAQVRDDERWSGFVAGARSVLEAEGWDTGDADILGKALESERVREVADAFARDER